MATRMLCAVAVLIGALLVPAGPALAAFGIQNLTAAPADTAAGAHSDFTVSFGISDPHKDLDDLLLHLPPGLIGDPSATPKCPQASFDSLFGCPANTRVGSTTVNTLTLGLPVPIAGDIFNLEASAGEPARLGVSLGGLIKKVVHVSVRASDYGLDARLNDVSAGLEGLIDVTGISMTLQGAPVPFSTNPTRCAPAQTTVEIASSGATPETASASASFTPSGCESVPFTPGFSVTPAEQPADLPTELAATITVPAGDTGGRRQSHVKRAEVVLPVGTALSAGVAAHGLEACSDAAFGAGGAAPSTCPPLSRIGAVEFDSPLLPAPLAGQVFLGEPQPGHQLRLFVLAQGSGVTIKLIGDVQPDPQTGQLTTSFDHLPELPFTSFTLSFRGGDDAVLTAPPGCGSHSASARLTPWSSPGGAPAEPTDGFATIDCPAAAFTPSLAAALDGSQAGGSAKLRLTVARPDRQPRLAAMHISFPPGLAGGLGSAALCPVATAQAGSCGGDSQVGTVRVVAGTGAAPLTLDGTLHLTAPVNGSVAGLAVAIPARVGPLDLGVVSAISELRLRPGDAGIDIATPALPRIVSGIPMAIRSLELNVNRDGFLRNATSCAPTQISASFGGAGGEQASSQAPYQATGCDTLSFHPKLALALDVSGKGPAVHSTIELPPGSANTRRVSVRLPQGVAPNLAAITGACPEATYQAGGCGAAATVGEARVDTPLLPVPLAGPVVLVMPQGATLPDVVAELNGPLPLKVRGSVALAPDGRLVTTFDGLPDVPLSRFALDFAGGARSAVVVARGLCGRKNLRTGWDLSAHNGATRTAETQAPLKGCTARRAAKLKLSGSVRLRGRRATLGLRVAATGRRMHGLQVLLPKGLRVDGRGARSGTTLKANGRLARRARLTTGRGSLRLALPKGRSARILVLRTKALKPAAGLRRGSRVAVRVRVSFAGAKSRTYRARLPVR